QTVEIVGIEAAQMAKLSEIPLEDDCYVPELYVQGDRLVVVYGRTEYAEAENGAGGAYKDYVRAAVYDISDRTDPKKAGEISQSGCYNTMRVKDGYVYMISSFYAELAVARDDA